METRSLATRHFLFPEQLLQGLPGGSVVKNLPANAGDTGYLPGSGRSHRERNGNPIQYSCLENPMDGGAWEAAVHGVAKSRTRLSNFPFTFHFHALEKEMATHSSVLAWRIPGTEEPGGLQSMGSLRVGCDSATSLSLFIFIFHFHALEKEMATHFSVLAWD